MLTDPIADMLTRLRNAKMAHHKQASCFVSKMKLAIATILKAEGYITDVTVEGSIMNITLKYSGGVSVLSGLRRRSKPSRRLYVSTENIPSIQNGLGICILSTSKGILSGEEARTKNVGGELLCEIW